MWRCEICRYDMQMYSHVIIFEELLAQALQMNLVGWKQKSGGKPTLVGKTMPETFKDQCKQNHPESSSILGTMNNASIDAVQKSSNATSHTKHHGIPRHSFLCAPPRLRPFGCQLKRANSSFWSFDTNQRPNMFQGRSVKSRAKQGLLSKLALQSFLPTFSARSNSWEKCRIQAKTWNHGKTFKNCGVFKFIWTERNLFKKPFIANDAWHQTAPCTTMHHHFHV